MGGRHRVEYGTGVAPFEKSTGVLAAGQSIAIVTPGAGGYGPPDGRAPEYLRRDLAEDRISPEVARDVYGLDAPPKAS
jgi:N-methylhydantoinase B